MLRHYTTAKLQSRSLPSCLGTLEPDQWGESARIDFEVVLMTRHIHASMSAVLM
jgi:hypothetical protein